MIRHPGASVAKTWISARYVGYALFSLWFTLKSALISVWMG